MKTQPGMFLSVLAAIAVLATAPAAQAQIGPTDPFSKRPLVGPWEQLPDIAPWEKALRRFYEREKILQPVDPLAKTEGAARSIYADPAKKLGLPDQLSPDSLRPKSPAVAPALPADILALDYNGDGGITRREYIEQRMRTRPIAPGPAAEARRRNVLGRVRSRFNGADTDRNGILSADELRAVIDPRF
jgi:hypothetical protein